MKQHKLSAGGMDPMVGIWATIDAALKKVYSTL